MYSSLWPQIDDLALVGGVPIAIGQDYGDIELSQRFDQYEFAGVIVQLDGIDIDILQPGNGWKFSETIWAQMFFSTQAVRGAAGTDPSRSS